MSDILLTPQKLSQLTGVSVRQLQTLMKSGRLEFVQISPRKRMLTLSAWNQFQQEVTVPAEEDGHHANSKQKMETLQ